MTRALMTLLACLTIIYIAYVVGSINHPFVADGATLEWASIPGPVRETLMVYTQGGRVNSVIKGTKHRHPIYKAEVTLPDTNKVTLRVDETGNLIGLQYADENEEDFGNKPTVHPTR